MTTNNELKTEGLRNSSITRVRPFFDDLFKQDPTGLTWLPRLLTIVSLGRDHAKKLRNMDCRIQVTNQSLNKLGEPTPDAWFEYRLAPSKSFLEWLIRNPGALNWPDNGKETYGNLAQSKREDWFGCQGEISQNEAIDEALDHLMQIGADSSFKKWWAFEGFTMMDCLLETDDFLLGIEGKRTDKVSPATHWYPKRNQIIRNLEVLKEKAGTKEYALLLMSENGKDPITDNDFDISLPHYSEQEIAEIKTHYFGAVSWRQACEAVGLDYNALPETTQDVCQSIER